MSYIKILTAIKEGDIDEVKRLIPYQELECVYSLLEHIIKYGSPKRDDIFSLILENTEVDIDHKDPVANGMTLLMKTIVRNYPINCISLILRHTENIEIWDDDYETAIYITVWKYYYNSDYPELSCLQKNIAIELLKHGANPLTDFNDKTTIGFIVKKNMFDMFDLFVEYCKFDIVRRTLYHAINIRNYDFIEHSLKYAKDLNELDLNGKTPLEQARGLNPPDADIIELLEILSM